jgi:hypothetical protein
MRTADPVLTLETARVPPELLGSVPRDVRLTAGGMALVAVAIVCVLGALAAAIAMSIAYSRVGTERRLRDRESVLADAEVVQVALQRGEHPRRVVTYRYGLDGRSYMGRTTLRENDRRDMTRGTPIRIEYLPSRPEASWIAGDRPSGFPIWLIPLTALGLLAMGAFIGRGIRRQWILLSEGRVALARVTTFKKVHRDKHRAFRVSYEFQTLSGATQTSRCEIGKAPPPVGAVIPIVYHRDKPAWSAAYPLQLVRPGRLVN